MFNYRPKAVGDVTRNVTGETYASGKFSRYRHGTFDGYMLATSVLLLDFERIRGYKLSRHVQNTYAFNQSYLTVVSAPRRNS